LRHDCLIVQE